MPPCVCQTVTTSLQPFSVTAALYCVWLNNSWWTHLWWMGQWLRYVLYAGVEGQCARIHTYVLIHGYAILYIHNMLYCTYICYTVHSCAILYIHVLYCTYICYTVHSCAILYIHILCCTYVCYVYCTFMYKSLIRILIFGRIKSLAGE